MNELVTPSRPRAAGLHETSLAVPVTPILFAQAGPHAERRYLEFFTANIRNANTRAAYSHAVWRFSDWCDSHGFALNDLEPVRVSMYIESLLRISSPPTVKQHLAAIRVLMDWLVVGQVLPMSPAASVRGPKYSVKRGKTLVLTAVQARELLDSIDTSSLIGLRDRALIGTMAFSFARVSAVINMNVEDYWANGKRWWLRLHEKGGKFHEVPAHHKAEQYLDAYVNAAGISLQSKTPLFRTAAGRTGVLSDKRLSRKDALGMVKRRAAAANLPARTCNHTFRATGITAYLENGGTIERAQQIACHESPTTTKLYDRTSDELTLEEIERIKI